MRLLVILLVILLGCRGQTPVTLVPPRSLIIHADTEFTPTEREIIHRATDTLMSEVGMRVDVRYDLDFGKVEHLARFQNVTQLMRIARDAQLTRDMDSRYRGIVFGWSVYANPPRVYVAADVLNGGEVLYLHVVIHELLHAVGCDHVSDPNAVLYWQTDLKHQAVKLTEADRLELARALTPFGGIAGQKH